MNADPTYSIAVCNYNMAKTLELSLQSMIKQVDRGEFEIVVVDGGSTDGSREILRSLEKEYPNLRAILDRSDECDHLGGDRNISFEESRGEYVLESLDTDDRYFDGIVNDFVTIYHNIESAIDRTFFLSGTGINMAPRQLLLDIPYYDLGGAEDRDFWRRLFAREALIWLDHGPVSKEIGYHMDFEGGVRRDIHGKICDFQSGISLLSALKWSLSHQRYYVLERNRGPLQNGLKKPYDFVSHLYAYVKAQFKQHHPAPPQFRSKGSLERTIHEECMTLSEIEEKYGFETQRDLFSGNGRRAYVK